MVFGRRLHKIMDGNINIYHYAMLLENLHQVEERESNSRQTHTFSTQHIMFDRRKETIFKIEESIPYMRSFVRQFFQVIADNGRSV